MLGALAMLVGAATLGFAVNHFSPHGIPVFPQAASTPLPLPAGLKAISPRDAQAALKTAATVFVDARAPQEYAAGHVPGALNIPPSEFEARLLDHLDAIEGARAIITYCQSVECSEAVEVGERLLESYHGRVYVLEEGWRGWQAAGYPVRQGARP